MPNLPIAIISVLSIFLPLFCKPTFKKLCTLFCGHVLCRGNRTVTEILKRLNLRNIKNYSKYHDFFKKDRWSSLGASKQLFLNLANQVPGELVILVDSTVERRKGPKIKSLGKQRDAVRSTKSNKVLVTGIHWLIFSIGIKFPWCNRTWATPFLSIPMPPEEPLSSSTNKKDIQKRTKKAHLKEAKNHSEKAKAHIEKAEKHSEKAIKKYESAKKHIKKSEKYIEEAKKHRKEAKKHTKEAKKHTEEAEKHKKEAEKYPVVKRHKTMTNYVCQVVKLLSKWLPGRKITIVGDSAFATYALANTCIKNNIGLVSRMRVDARTFKFPDASKGRGRKKIVGDRLPTFKEMSEDPSTPWEDMEVDWYSESKKKLQVISGICLWYGYGIKPVPIKWVLTRESKDNDTVTVLFSTDIEMTKETIIKIFVSRWSLEVTFEESRRHLGMETQRQWSDKAIERTTPCILASYSVVNLVVLESLKMSEKTIPIQKSSWYKKESVTFSDVLAYLRREILKETFASVEQNPDVADLFTEFIEQMSAA